MRVLRAIKYALIASALVFSFEPELQAAQAVHNLPLATPPMQPGACMYIDQAGSQSAVFDARWCAASPLGSSMASFFGAMAISNNGSDVQNAASFLANIGGIGPSTVSTLNNKTISGFNNTLTVRMGPSGAGGDVTGTLLHGNGGTGIAANYLNGQLLIGDQTTGGLDAATLTQGTGITIANAPGKITISATGGTSGVSGPGVSVNNDLATWSGTAGNAIVDSGVLLSNVVTLTAPQTLTSKTINGASNSITVRLGAGSQTSLDTMGVLPYTSGGTGSPGPYANGTLLIGTGTGLSANTLTQGSGIIITNNSGAITIAASGSGGVAGPGSSTNNDIAIWNGGGGNTLADSGVLFSNIVTPTSTNTFTNKTFDGAATGNVLTVHLNTANVTGILPYTLGGTGSAGNYANGQLLIGNGTGLTPALLTQGTGISIANGSGSISVGLSGASAAVTTQNALAYYNTASTISGVTPANNSVVSTNGAGVPVESPILPGGLTITGPVTITGAASLTGTPTAPTQAASDNSTNIATTAFTKANWLAVSGGWIAGANPNNGILLSALPAAPHTITVQAVRCRAETIEPGGATVTIVHAAPLTALSGGTALTTGPFQVGTPGATPMANQNLALTGGVPIALVQGESIGFQSSGTFANSSGTCTVYYTPT